VPHAWLACLGGPNGNFVVDGKGLPASFAENSPKRLWQRNLGDDGYSCIVADGKLLYTMYRRGNQEVVVAMNPADGATKWEYAYDATFLPKMGMEHGGGPHATPLIMGNSIYTIGVLAKMHAFGQEDRQSSVVEGSLEGFPRQYLQWDAAIR